jgi:uncharacterized protein YegL
MIDFKVKLETIPETNSCISLFASIDDQRRKSQTDTDEFEVLPPFVECLLHLEAQHDMEETITNKTAEIVIIVDKSGSMQGTPWNQVQSALIKLMDIYREKHNCKVICYNQSAKQIELTGSKSIDNFKINSIRASGSTNFVAVFQELETIFQNQKEGASNLYQIFFMTDGHDTCNSVQEIMVAKEHLQAEIEKFGGEVVFNVLGFSSQHDDNFLESLSLIGTSDGSYNFVSPREGTKALEDRLIDVVESASSTIGKTINIEVKATNVEFLGEWFGDSEKEVVLPAKMTKKNGSVKITTRKFVRIQNGEEPCMDLNVYENLRGSTTPMEAKVVSYDHVELKDKNEIDNHNLKKLRAAMNMITRRMGESTAPNDEETVKAGYQFVKDKMFDMKNLNTAISDIKRHQTTVLGHIKQCAYSCEPGDVDERERNMSRRSAMSTVCSPDNSAQPQNMLVQRKRNITDIPGIVKRTNLQMKITPTDYSERSPDHSPQHSDED